MNVSPATIIADYLIGEGLLTDPDDSGSWPVYVGTLPDGDDVSHDAVGCIDTTPVRDGRTMGEAPLFHFGVQLLLRASDYNTGYSKASDLQDALASVDDAEEVVDDSGTTYTLVNVSDASGIVCLGQEEGTRRRMMFSTNFIATIREV
jgi:hypothetical protein